MSLSLITLALAKMYTDQTVKGEGAIKGKDGITPHIDPDTNNWVIGDKDTGINAAGINDYEKLINQPKINGETLTAETTTEDIGIKSLTNMEILDIINKTQN